MKSAVTYLLLWGLVLLSSCEKDFNNPYDPETPPEAWTPQNLTTQILGPNSVKLSWELSETRIEGLEITVEIDGDQTVIFLEGHHTEWINTSVLQSNELDECHVARFRIRALAGSQQSLFTPYTDAFFIPHPTAAFAGNDQSYTTGFSGINLSANSPLDGESGSWDILSGTGGSLSNVSDPNAYFSFQPGVSYTLRWTITAPCGISSDNVNIAFAGQGASFGGILVYEFQPGDPGYVPGEQHGIIAATEDVGLGGWCCQNEIFSTSDGIGSGLSNTQAILNSCSSCFQAAQECDNYSAQGYSDWFLPSIEELTLLYENLHQEGVGNFQNGAYWSSSEVDEFNAKSIHFGTGQSGFSAKYTPLLARPIRYF